MLLNMACQTVPVASAAINDDRTADGVLKRLQEGNERYLTGKSLHRRFDPERRKETATNGQTPFTTVLGCSDSRVPPEVVFDQGFSDVFVIRVAGNVCGESELASAEYGTKYLGTQLLVVLGHSNCGAVAGTLAGKELSGSLPKLVAMIKPAVDKAAKAHPELKGDALLDAAVETNVHQSMEQLLKGSSVLRELVKTHKLKIVGAIRDLKTGKVRFIGELPDQAKLL